MGDAKRISLIALMVRSALCGSNAERLGMLDLVWVSNTRYLAMLMSNLVGQYAGAIQEEMVAGFQVQRGSASLTRPPPPTDGMGHSE